MPDKEAFKSFLDTGQVPPDIQESTLIQDVPFAGEAERQASMGAVMEPGSPTQTTPGLTGPELSFTQRNRIAGIPLDTTTGAPASIRAGVALRRDTNDKLIFLNEQFGNDFSRVADNGALIARTIDPDTGQAKDVVIDEETFTAKDLLDLVSVLPEIAGGIGGMKLASAIPKLGKAMGVTGFVRGSAASAVGAQTAGAVQDLAMTDTMSAEQIAGERASLVPVDMFFDLVGGLGIVAAGKAISPFAGSKQQIQFDAKNAQKYFQDRYGVNIPLTAGERTGSPSLTGAEAHIANLPGGKGVTRRTIDKKTQAFRQIQNIMLGLPEDATLATRRTGIPSDEAVGLEMAEGIRRQVDPAVEGVESARRGVVEESTTKIMKDLDAITTRGGDLSPGQVGADIRQAAEAKRQAFREQSNELYEQAFSLPGGRDRVFAPKSLETEAQKILDSMPGFEGEAGREVTRLTPSNVVPTLEELKRFGQEGVVSLEDLKNIRTQVSNMIAEGEAIPGVQTMQLTKIRNLITDTMEEMTESLPDTRLKNAWKKANEHYAENIGQFEQPHIRNFFKDLDQPGFLEDEQIVLRVFDKESPLKRMKEFFGADSTEFLKLKRTVANRMFNRSLLPGEDLIDGKAFAKDLEKLRRMNRPVYDEIFGKEGMGLYQTSHLAALAQADKISIKDLEQALKGTEGTMGTRVRAMISAQKKADDLFRSKLLKQVADGDISDINAAEFANRFFDNASEAEIRHVKSLLADSPDVLNKIRVKTIEKIFHEAATAAKATDPSRLAQGEAFRAPGALALERYFGSESNKRKMVELLGNDTYTDFVELAKMIRVGEVGQSAFSAAAGLSAGMQIASAWRHGPMGYAADWVKQRMAALILATPAVREMWTNTLVDNRKIAQGQALFFASSPVVTALIDHYGPEAAQEMMIHIKGSIDRFVTEGPPDPQRRQFEQMDREAFQKFLDTGSLP